MSSTQASGFAQYTLIALAAVALGGTQLGGGRGGLVASLLGACCIYLMQTLLGALEVSSAWLNFVYGCLLVAGVVVGAKLLTLRPRGGDGMSQALALQRRAPVLQLLALVALFALRRGHDRRLQQRDHRRLDAGPRRAARARRARADARPHPRRHRLLGAGAHRHGRDRRQRALRRAPLERAAGDRAGGRRGRRPRRGHRLDLSPLAHPAADRDARHRRDQRGCGDRLDAGAPDGRRAAVPDHAHHRDRHHVRPRRSAGRRAVGARRRRRRAAAAPHGAGPAALRHGREPAGRGAGPHRHEAGVGRRLRRRAPACRRSPAACSRASPAPTRRSATRTCSPRSPR